jgi:hypothetical protein
MCKFKKVQLSKLCILKYGLRRTTDRTTMFPSIINIHQGIQKLWTGHDLQTDGRTEGRTDKVIPIYPSELRSWGVLWEASLNIDVQVEIIMHVIGLSGLPGTMKVHAVSPVCSEFIMIRNMSCYCQGCNNNLSDRAWTERRTDKVGGIMSKLV